MTQQPQQNQDWLKGLQGNPFDLDNPDLYEKWKTLKLEHYPADTAAITVHLQDPYSLRSAEKDALIERCTQCNMVIYQVDEDMQDDKSLVQALGSQLGLVRLDTNLRADEDSVTSLEVRGQTGNQYIPYTNKPLSWHTDGYYNTADQQVRAVILHCAAPAAEGGVNSLLDHELLYIRLRDENPNWIDALMHAEAMTIPPNVEDGQEIRGQRSGPVFSIDPATGSLHMRYSARKKNISWRDDPFTREAADRIGELLKDESMVLRHRLLAGQGIIGNNVLHNRTAFEDKGTMKRLMYRARYYDRIAGTGFGNYSTK